MMIGIVLMGAPCCGKSTIGKEVAQHYNVPYISSGDIARGMGERDKQVEKDLIAGKMAPEDFMRKAVYERLENEDMFILDGFPRFADQREWLERVFNNAQFVYIYIRCDYEELLKRSVNRCRSDDNSFKNRMDYFANNTYPMILRMKEMHDIYMLSIDNTKEDSRDGIMYNIRKYLEVDCNVKNSWV